jgi:putative FmdB family regulatory protein
MPIYCYKCPGCGERMEVFQKRPDYSPQQCQECGTPMEKIIGPVGVIFKGSGFYCTDYKKNGRTPLKREENGREEGRED